MVNFRWDGERREPRSLILRDPDFARTLARVTRHSYITILPRQSLYVFEARAGVVGASQGVLYRYRFVRN